MFIPIALLKRLPFIPICSFLFAAIVEEGRATRAGLGGTSGFCILDGFGGSGGGGPLESPVVCLLIALGE
jgi:hypothetical protein